jgi:hypothetical protein
VQAAAGNSSPLMRIAPFKQIHQLIHIAPNLYGAKRRLPEVAKCNSGAVQATGYILTKSQEAKPNSGLDDILIPKGRHERAKY